MDEEASMTYTIESVVTGRGLRYRIMLWCGRVCYVGQRTYERRTDAERAAKRTGAQEVR